MLSLATLDPVQHKILHPLPYYNYIPFIRHEMVYVFPAPKHP